MERRRRKKMNEEIKMEEWKKYFMGLLGGVEERMVRGGECRERIGGDEEISRKKIRGALKKMKDRKAAGMDGIPGEVWKYGGESLEK